jgi:hypothetical protein
MEESLILARLEEVSETRPILFEARGGMNLRFFFGSADLKNKNGRTYPMAVFSKRIAEAQAKITAGASIFGSADHMAQFGINDISHRITKLGMENKNGVAEAAILKTDRGRNLQAVIDGKGSVGASMRGVGSTNKEGIIQDDWRLDGIDFVLGPSFDTHVSQANVFESEELTSITTENIDGRYVMALRSGYKGSMQEFRDGLNTKGDDAKISVLYQGAIKAGYRGSYSDFRKSYLGRKS